MMTPEQAKQQLKTALAINESIANLLRVVAEHEEIAALRESYKCPNSHAEMLIAVVKGKAISDFINDITAPRPPGKVR